MAPETRTESRIRRHERVREKVRGSADRPRLAVFRSLTHIYAQLIDDSAGRTLVAASSVDAKDGKGKKSERAKAVGTLLGERAKAKGIETAVFDRGGYRYHGRIKALGDGARSAGLRF
ncbi:MAG: 50S ribosomal protein L18 [Chloroflexi bacterium]|nr:MAG: 50S ribosomal protein L18 [Chloroflexota bacterium]